MRYIKTFNENTENLKEELLDLCEGSLAYLIDDGIKVDIEYNNGPEHGILANNEYGYWVTINLSENPKEWSEIKDHMIPFLTRINNKYQMMNFMGIKRNTTADIYVFLTLNQVDNIFASTQELKIEQLINDRVIPEFNTKKIDMFKFKVVGYKPQKKSFLTKIKSFFN